LLLDRERVSLVTISQHALHQNKPDFRDNQVLQAMNILGGQTSKHKRTINIQYLLHFMLF
jgi:hypothetical protein